MSLADCVVAVVAVLIVPFKSPLNVAAVTVLLPALILPVKVARPDGLISNCFTKVSSGFVEVQKLIVVAAYSDSTTLILAETAGPFKKLPSLVLKSICPNISVLPAAIVVLLLSNVKVGSALSIVTSPAKVAAPLSSILNKISY